MTVSSTTSKSGPFAGNGVTVNFAIGFKYTSTSDVAVIVTSAAGVETTKTITTHYTITAPGDSGTVTFLTAPASGETVTIVRTMPMTQTTDYTAGGGFSSQTVEDTDDRQLMQIQEIAERVSRAPKLRQTTSTTTPTFPEPLANGVIKYNAAADNLEAAVPADLDLALVTPFIETLLDDVDAATARTTLDAQQADADLTAIAALTTTTYGRSLLTLADDDALAAEISEFYQPLDSDLTAIAALTTTAYGRALLALADDAALQSYIGVRDVLVANRTYYVRSDGSDSNTGLVDSAGGAFLTIQKAVDVVSLLDVSSFIVTIQVGDGTFAGFELKPYAGIGPVILRGNNSTPANVVITTASASVNTIYGEDAGFWRLLDFAVSHTGVNSSIDAVGETRVEFGNLRFGAAGAYQFRTRRGARGIAISNYAITAGAIAHFFAGQNSTIEAYTITTTLTGTPAFSGAFAQARHSAVITHEGGSFSGSATGKRYTSETNGYIDTDGAGETYFPGDAAGTTADGGWYDQTSRTANLRVGVTPPTSFGPTAIVEVNGSGDALTAGAGNLNARFVNTDGTNGTGVGIGFSNSADEENIGAKIVHNRTGGNSQGHLDFYTKPDTTLGDTSVRALRITSAGAVLANLPTAGIGYTTGAGGTVTQATSKSTTVVLNTACGEITMNGASLAAGTAVAFTLTDSAIAVGDNLILNHVSVGSLGHYALNARCGAGSATIDVRNNTGGALAEAIVIRFILVKGVTS